jgi:hypothetical protein
VSDDLRYYIVRAEVRDDETIGEAHLGVLATSRDEAISKARGHARDSSHHRRRIVRVVSARLSEHFTGKETHA